MEMTEIRKQSLTVVDAVNDTMLTLAEQAKDLLGYDALAKAVGTRMSVIELTPLQAALKSLDIDILNTRDVTKYKKERLAQQTKESMEKWVKEELEPADEIRNYFSFAGPRWDREKIKEYKQPIPEFVLAKAIQIKQVYPECEIWVESLQEHPDPFLAVGIPGQSEYYAPKELYYVEVWEEPKFEGHLRNSPAEESEIPFL